MAQQALRGVALVVGQSDYEFLPKLPNPRNDARQVDKLLSNLGFKTNLVDNRSARRLERDFAEFLEDAEGADVAVIYYSGHGIEAGGENFLLPVDARIDEGKIEEGKLVRVSEILEELRGKVSIVILLLDACRTNPLPSATTIRLQDGTAALPIRGDGLAAVKGVMLVDQPAATQGLGEVVGFAAAPGQVALDGEAGGNSPYAAAIVKHLAAKGLDFGR